ncbi:hypothetical protein L195_g006170 [Trifolium pratense]|uniref:Uncharacterized protein n=1 Tax=Trifolium pratense TaxID=57577 RepID=A0A2K3P2U8_TRIPR|nr:hypothetical protein L195_g006170 [Trifolium pratense]
MERLNINKESELAGRIEGALLPVVWNLGCFFSECGNYIEDEDMAIVEDLSTKAWILPENLSNLRRKPFDESISS